MFLCAAGRFIEDAARLLIPWGVPQTAARLYGYLLLCAEPVSLDRITADLEISKSSASVAAREQRETASTKWRSSTWRYARRWRQRSGRSHDPDRRDRSAFPACAKAGLETISPKE